MWFRVYVLIFLMFINIVFVGNLFLGKSSFSLFLVYGYDLFIYVIDMKKKGLFL